MRRFGHVPRRDRGDVGRRRPGTELAGRRPRGRPERRFRDAAKEDKRVVGVRVEDAQKRCKRKAVIRCGDA